MSTYTPPVDRLLTLGAVTWGEPWRDYQALGLGPEHQGELIQMLRDMDLHCGDTDSPGVWAPVHAWRALAQMRIAEAVTPYLETLAELEEKDSDDGLMPEELRDFCLAIGEPSLPALIDFVTADGPTYTRGATVDTLAKLAGAYPARRGEVIAVLSGVLARAATNDAALNGFILGALLDLKAVEAIDTIRAAFATGNVDDTIAGDLEEAEFELGLRDKPPAPRNRWARFAPPVVDTGLDRRSAREKLKARAKRQVAKASRKRNRKRKKR